MMSFTSFQFIIFFTVVYVLLWGSKWIFQKNENFTYIYEGILLVASYVFMALADWRFAICLFALTLIIYCSALNIKKHKIWFAVGIICSIAQLAIFKYLNFFVDTFSKLLGSSSSTINIIVPLGVSFYTFSGISYLMDVNHGKYEANKNFVDVALFMSFFPKLTSGPIIRTDRFLKQLDKNHMVSIQNLEIGIQIVLCGFFKKMVLADHLSIFVDDVFAAPSAFSGATVFLATIAYSLQIYFDFSGYSDIAIGLSKMMGYDFDKNFNLPYLSKNPTEFWKRWHISLSSWLQEYLYYPLGGNRKGKIRTYINLFLTMVIGGLWHGANWTFIIWGAIHGIALIMHKLFMKWKAAMFGTKDSCGEIRNILSAILTFLFVNFCWIFFRAENLSSAMIVIRQIFSSTPGINQPYTWAFFAFIIAIAELALACIRKKRNSDKLVQEYLILDLSKTLQLAIFFALVGITIIMAYIGNTAFIYGNF